MSELISKQAAIDAVMDEFKRIPTNAIRAKIRIEALPPAQPEPCEDAVSRAEVLRMINCINDHHAITPYKSVGAITEHLTRIASNLPPVTPKQHIDADGTLWVTVPDIERVTRVIVDEEKSKFCRQFYMEEEQRTGKWILDRSGAYCCRKHRTL